MTKSQRQLAVLGGLLVVLAGVLVLRPGSAPSQTPAAAPQPGQPVEGTTAAVPVTGLHLDLLAAKDSALGNAARNPFRFMPRPAPAPRAAIVSRPEPTLPPAPVGPPPPPPIPLKFIGVLDAPARVGRLAILSDSRGGVFYGKEGDTIEGRYKVIKISDETAELAYMDGRGRQTIRLSGQ
jgi:hypothetical protein